MKKFSWKVALAFSVVVGIFLLAGCGGGGSLVSSSTPTGTGTMRVTIQWPTRAIPENTAYVTIKISGVGLDKPIEKRIERQAGQTEVSITINVPAGDKTIIVTAYDANGKPLAVGATSATVVANTTTTATVELGEIKGAFLPLQVGNEWTYDLTITNNLGTLSKEARQGLPDYVPYPFEAKGEASWKVVSYEENLFPSPVYALQMTHKLTSITPISGIETPPPPPSSKGIPHSPSIIAYLSGGTTENLLLWGIKNDCPQCQYEDEIKVFNPPLLLLNLSLPQSWAVGKAFGLIWNATFAGNESIETKIGTFDCVKISYTSTPVAVTVKKSDKQGMPARAIINADVWFADKLGVVKEVITIIPSGFTVSQGKEKPIWQCTYLLNGTNLLGGNVEVVVK
ncbi:hypothetical protein H5T87_07335 [bacterium]|nr:hypothetical protein [bacterium]